LKIDCEGAEEEILFHCPDPLFNKIKTITIEWHDDLSRLGFDNFKNFLIKKNYQFDFDNKTGTIYASRT